MNRRGFLTGSVLAVAAAPILAKTLTEAPSALTFPNPPVIPRYGVLRGGTWDSRRDRAFTPWPGPSAVELNEVWIERALQQMAENIANTQGRIAYAAITGRPA